MFTDKIRGHADLCCKHHPDLRWNTKIQALSGRKYTGARNIFYRGFADQENGRDAYPKGERTYTPECDCPLSDLYAICQLSQDDASTLAELAGGVACEDDLVPGGWYVATPRGAYTSVVCTYDQAETLYADLAWKEKNRHARTSCTVGKS